MIGMEPTWDDHLENLLAVFKECHRALRPDGTFWLNYGDAYAAASKGSDGTNSFQTSNSGSFYDTAKFGLGAWKPKDLLMMPARLAIALQSTGWWIRSEIVWHKPNPMPESVTDRPSTAHEKVFLLAKSQHYWYDPEAVRLPLAREFTPETNNPGKIDGSDKYVASGIHGGSGFRRGSAELGGANLRNVWSIPPAQYKDAHFAVFPQKLAWTCIAAGTSEHGVCAKCKAPYARIVDTPKIPDSLRNREGVKMDFHTRALGGGQAIQDWRNDNPPTTTGWQASCTCNAGIVPATVLDPFGGSGTIGEVAALAGRDAILCEINGEYVRMAEKRINGSAPLLAGNATITTL